MDDPILYQGLEDSVAKMGWSVGSYKWHKNKTQRNGSSNSCTMITYKARGVVLINHKENPEKEGRKQN